MKDYEDIMQSTQQPIAVAGLDTPLDECLFVKGRIYSHPTPRIFSGTAVNESWSKLEPDLAA